MIDSVVCFFVVLFSVFCIMCFDIVLSVEVVLFSKSIGGFFSRMCVIVMCCFLFLERW